MAPRRGLARPRTFSPPAAANSGGGELPLWARRAIERGRMTEQEYRDGERERAERRRVDLIRRVPSTVEAEGAAAIQAWADEWLAIDLRLWGGHRQKGDPRAPLDYPEMRQLGLI